MIDDDVLPRVLSAALRAGGEFAEVFAEDKRSTSAVLDDGRIEELSSGRDRGAGIRVISGETTGFAHTSDLTEAAKPLGAWTPWLGGAIYAVGVTLAFSAPRRSLPGGGRSG